MTNTLATRELFSFFEEAVEQAAKDVGAELSEDASLYLVTLLVDACKTDHLFWERGPTTLVDLHIRARRAPPSEQVRLYKLLGDHALTIAGFFPDSLSRKLVGVEYYAQMGGAAYRTVADLFAASSAGGNLLTRLFAELGERIRTCIGVLSDVGDRIRSESAPDLLRLYERWLTTRDPRTGQRLAQLGVLKPGFADA